MRMVFSVLSLLLVSTLVPVGITHAEENKPTSAGELLNSRGDFDIGMVKPEHGADVALAKDGDGRGVKISFAAGAQYPGAQFVAPDGVWDLSGFTGVEATITNAGNAACITAFRADNEGDWEKKPEPWNCESITIAPGDTKSVTVTFGKTFGQPGYPLDPKKVNRFLVFAGNASENGSLIVRSVKAVK